MSVTTSARRLAVAIFISAALSAVSAYDPPAGAFFLPGIATPWSLASTPTVVGDPSPWASRLNPSASAAVQQARIEAAYTGLTDFGKAGQGWGSAASIAFSAPQPFGVLGGSLRLVSVPGAMTQVPLGTLGELRLNFAKDIFPNVYAGIGLGGSYGYNGGSAWGLGVDLGFTFLAGDLGFLKDFRWGIALTDMGKGYATPLPATGSLGTSGVTSYPSAFTLGIGARALLVRSYAFNLSMAMDLRTPSFQDVSAGLGFSLRFRDVLTLTTGWTIGLRDMIADSGRSLIPTIGLSASIPLESRMLAPGKGMSERSVAPAIAAAPLYGDILAMSAGVSLAFGVRDKAPPRIEPLPAELGRMYYFSPNGDGIKDFLRIPFRVTDERYVAGWEFRIDDTSAGKVVRRITRSVDRPEAYTGLGSLAKGLFFTRRNVEIPPVLEWDGKDDVGKPVPDGSYMVSIRAWDDNGTENTDFINCLNVIVDTKPLSPRVTALDRVNFEPLRVSAAELDSLGPKAGTKYKDLIFSPDKDGRFDEFRVRLEGENASSWKVQVLDSSNAPVFTKTYPDSFPEKEFSWDGTGDSGKVVPDGAYSVRLVGMNESGSTGVSAFGPVMVDTRRPEVALGLDAFQMSPNGDGRKDAIVISAACAMVDGLEDWSIRVVDEQRKEVWRMAGSGTTPLPQSTVFDGIVGGSRLDDGKYEAEVALSFVNGYNPVKYSDTFIIDSTPPAASIAMKDANRVFSPDGDGSRDAYEFDLETSEEDAWDLSIIDPDGGEVFRKTFSGTAGPRFIWDGRDSSGKAVPDGEYYLALKATDRAANETTVTTEGTRLKVDTRRPALRLAIPWKAFSPNGDGVQDTLPIELDSESTDGIVGWKLAVRPLPAGADVWTKSGPDAAGLVRTNDFSGLDDRGTAIPEGTYVAAAELSYVNGYSVKAETTPFVLDVTYPAASVRMNRTVFNPAGDGTQNRIRISESGSREESWIGEVIDSAGAVVRRWSLGSALPDELAWDGANDAGTIVPDGAYSFALRTVDPAGNGFKSAPQAITIDTLRKAASLTIDQGAFSPNGDGKRETLAIALQATAPERIDSYEVRISAVDAQGLPSGEVVRAWKGTGNFPGAFTWDGMTATGNASPDGRYAVSGSIRYPNGDRVDTAPLAVLLDRVPPKVTVTQSLALFSPNGDGRSDTVAIGQVSAPGDDWTATISDAGGRVVRKYEWKNEAPGFTWDGTDQGGNLVPDGSYSYRIWSADAAGNSFEAPPVKVAVEVEKKTVRLNVDRKAFSPNGDKVLDTVTLVPSIQAPERLRTYELTVVAQDGPAAFSAVRTWKGTGAAPAQFAWDGKTDAGIAVPDGRYAASLAVVYLNDDMQEAASPAFVLDTVAPSITVSVSAGLFSPNGDGRLDTVEIRQDSVPGDEWAGKIKAADGKVVRSWVWKSRAETVTWDGKDDSGVPLKDGVYRYEATSADAAGNRGVNAPAVSIEIEKAPRTLRFGANRKVFSPNEDGVKDSLEFQVEATTPERLERYELAVRPEGAAAGSAAVRTWAGKTDLKASYAWDGRSDAGQRAADGRYVAVLTLRYRNGDVAEGAVTGIVVDTVAPSITVGAAPLLFSPNGDGRSDAVRIGQVSVPGDDWTGRIVSASGAVLRTWTWKQQAQNLEWDGRDQAGNLLADGEYKYQALAVDEAGNSAVNSPEVVLEIETAKRVVQLTADQKAFSPNGDGVQDALNLNARVTAPEGVESWELAIRQADGAGAAKGPAVKAWKGTTDLKEQYAWDGGTDSGIRAPDGRYMATLSVHYRNDDFFKVTVPAFALDTVAPKITVEPGPLVFSPNGDGSRDTLIVNQKSIPGDDWTGRIVAANGMLVRTWTWKDEAKGFTWDGKDNAGVMSRDGVYTYTVSSTDAAGNRGSVSIIGISMDAFVPKVYVTASDNGISPNGDGVRDDVSFTLVADRRESIESWRFSLLDGQGVERSFFGGSGPDMPARLVWDGHDLQGQIVQGDYIGSLVVKYSKGDVAKAVTGKVTVKVNPPEVAISVKPEYFSPDGDGIDEVLEMGIKVAAPASIVSWNLDIMETAVVESGAPGAMGAERMFMQWNGKGAPPATLAWDGKSTRGELVESATNYPFRFTARDVLGNTTKVSGVIAVDVLVIRDGDRLKIKVPSIVFRANYADFVGLDQETVSRNERVVARIAQILNKFPDYRIRIEGHANNVGKMLGFTAARIQAEEEKEIVPLSTGRAEVVRGMLVQNKVDARRLTVSGLGSSEPVVSFLDVENRWKNRRVEFILIKNR